LIDKLESSDKDAMKLVAKTKAEVAKRHARSATTALTAQSKTTAVRPRAIQSTIPDVPHIPIQDDWYAYDEKYVVRSEGYYDPLSEAVRKDREGVMRGGGYVVEEAWERAIRCAIAGLELSPPSASLPAQRSNDGDIIMETV